MYEQAPDRKPKATHYVSTHNGGVYPAQHGLPGYEDDNPADWRVATAAEIEAYKQGKVAAPPISEQTVDLLAKPAVSTPTTLKLADDPEPTAATEALAADPSDPPPAPPGIGLPPAPAFDPK